MSSHCFQSASKSKISATPASSTSDGSPTEQPPAACGWHCALQTFCVGESDWKPASSSVAQGSEPPPHSSLSMESGWEAQYGSPPHSEPEETLAERSLKARPQRDMT